MRGSNSARFAASLYVGRTMQAIALMRQGLGRRANGAARAVRSSIGPANHQLAIGVGAGESRDARFLQHHPCYAELAPEGAKVCELELVPAAECHRLLPP